MAIQTVGYREDFAARLDQGLKLRLKPKGRMQQAMLCRETGFGRTTLHGWRNGTQAFSLPALLRMDEVLAAHGMPGLFAEVTAPSRARWDAERLPLDSLKDTIRGEFLRSWMAGGEPVELAAKMGLIPHATLLAVIDGNFFSVHAGSETEVDDKAVHGKPLMDRADKDYAGLVYAHMKTTLGEPTLWRMKSKQVSYTRLAVPGRSLVLTLPFDPDVPPGYKVR